MVVIISALLSVLVICVIVYPFLRDRTLDRRSSTLGDIIQILRLERESLYEEMKSVQIDHNIGLITRPEYSYRLGALRLKAMESLKKQEIIESDIDEALEKVISANSSEDRSDPY